MAVVRRTVVQVESHGSNFRARRAAGLNSVMIDQSFDDSDSVGIHLVSESQQQLPSTGTSLGSNQTIDLVHEDTTEEDKAQENDENNRLIVEVNSLVNYLKNLKNIERISKKHGWNRSVNGPYFEKIFKWLFPESPIKTQLVLKSIKESSSQLKSQTMTRLCEGADAANASTPAATWESLLSLAISSPEDTNLMLNDSLITDYMYLLMNRKSFRKQVNPKRSEKKDFAIDTVYNSFGIYQNSIGQRACIPETNFTVEIEGESVSEMSRQVAEPNSTEVSRQRKVAVMIDSYKSLLFSHFSHGFIGENILDADRIFMPINIGNAHWILGVVDFKQSNIVIFDSLGNSSTCENYGVKIKKILMFYLSFLKIAKNQVDNGKSTRESKAYKNSVKHFYQKMSRELAKENPQRIHIDAHGTLIFPAKEFENHELRCLEMTMLDYGLMKDFQSIKERVDSLKIIKLTEPTQNNGYDCGVFVLAAATVIREGFDLEKYLKYDRMPEIRQSILGTLLHGFNN